MRLTFNDLLQRFKATSDTLIGLEDRFELLKHVAQVLQHRPDYFCMTDGQLPRPGNMMGKINVMFSPAPSIYTN